MTTPDDAQAQLRQAQARLDEAMEDLDRRIAGAKQVEASVPNTRLSEKDIEQIEAFAKSRQAPKELRELQRRIDEGELSWQDIASGRGFDDPQVQQALSGNMPDLHRAYLQLQEGEHIDDVIDTGRAAPARPDDHFDGEADGEGGSGFMRRGW